MNASYCLYGVAFSMNPTGVLLYLTKRCNSRCPFCTWILKDPNFFHTRTDMDMPFNEAKSIVDYYYNIGIRRVRLQAEGEILLYAHLRELLEYCKNKGYTGFNFPTNAILLDQYIDLVLESLSSISISVDGYDASTFIAQRGGVEATFYKVIGNIRELVNRRKKLKSKIKISVNCVIHSKDYKIKALPMIRLVESLGVDVIRFANFHAIEGGGGLEPLSAKDICHLQKLVKRSGKIKVKLPKLGNRQIVESRKSSKFYCSMISNMAVIGSQGNYAPCCRIDSDPKWGSFSDDQKHNSKTLQKLRKSFESATHVEHLGHPYCHNCTRLKKGR